MRRSVAVCGECGGVWREWRSVAGCGGVWQSEAECGEGGGVLRSVEE